MGFNIRRARCTTCNRWPKPRGRGLRAALTLVALSGMVGCGESDTSPVAAPASSGDYPASKSALIPLDGQVLYPVQLDERPGFFQMVVDTGAFATSIDERLVRELENGVGKVSVGLDSELRFEDIQVFGADLALAENYIGTPIHGLIGQDIFMQAFFGLDYRASEVTAAGTVPLSAPPGFENVAYLDVPYTLEQLLPIVEVEIGGRTARLIADTGSGVTLLTESFVSPELLAGGITGYAWHTSYGSDPGTIVRLPSVGLNGGEVQDSWAVVVPDDYHLEEVFDGLDVQVDGFLGYPVYRRFYVGVHGAENLYRFYPYPDTSHIDGLEWDRIGVEIRREEGVVRIDMVFEPSSAKTAGVQVNDAISSVDGRSVAALPLDEVRLLLRGTPGQSRSLELERGGTPMTLQVEVDRLLPPLN